MYVNASYSLGKVIEFLQKNEYEFKVSSSSGAGYCGVEHGVRAIVGGGIEISIQTHPVIAGSSFAETGIMHNDNMIFPRDLGYFEDIRRHNEQVDLFAYHGSVCQVLEALMHLSMDNTVINSNYLKHSDSL